MNIPWRAGPTTGRMGSRRLKSPNEVSAWPVSHWFVSAHPVPETELLVRAALDGQRSAFDALVRMHLRAAYAVALAVVGRPADAEDVAQIALVTAFEKLEQCREPARFRAWLLQIVRNRAKNWLDERRLRDVSPDATPPEARLVVLPPVSPVGQGERERLIFALQSISRIRREIVLLHDLEGWTHREIAESLEISESLSRQHLFQARRELRRLLGESQELGNAPCMTHVSI